MANIRAHLGLTDDTQSLRIRALLRDFMCMVALDFSVSWKQQDKIWERIPRFRRLANNWAGEPVVQDIFNHRRTHMLKLERENKNRTTEKHNGKYNDRIEINTSKEANPKHAQPDKVSNRQRPPSNDDDVDDSDSDDDEVPPTSPNLCRNSPIGRSGSPTVSCATSPDRAPRANERPRQEGARSNREHGAQEEGEDVPAAHQDGPEPSREQCAPEENGGAPATGPRCSNCRPPARFVAAALAAANGAAEDNNSARKAAGSSKKGSSGKAKAKAKKGKDEELFPNEGEEDNGDDN
ncbi:hypothetical protein BDV93DRAFT_516052 [Ceratobasidium sp. AG-I]|nr:hypothetical protein BDV93DRAFT_516052 [Ceratobasidium sp. AG-I]